MKEGVHYKNIHKGSKVDEKQKGQSTHDVRK